MAGHVVFVGLMGAGKTTIGTRVARRLGLPFVDSDRELERQTGHTAREILADDGVDVMHAQEAAVVRAALDSPERTVIAAPASIVDSPEMRERLKQEDVVWLRTDPQELIARMKVSHNTERPFVDRDPEVLLRQFETRRPLYEEIASFTVDTTHRDKDEIADEIVDDLT
jgi:shikimate kinase